MPAFDRHLWRLAGRIANRLAHHHPLQVPIRLDQALWSTARQLASTLDHLAARSWSVASGYLQSQLQTTLRRLQSNLCQSLQELPPERKISEPPRQRDIYEELLATRDEFGDFEFDLRQQFLSVTTEPIVLEDLFLGRFRIRLDLKILSGHGDYQVVAETPVYSAERSEVCHPHILDETLCEGNGSEALENALLTGRFSDFFQIIQQTLETYNAGSAYANLDDWKECTVCHACGDTVSTDSSDYCETCDFVTCDSCSTSCTECGCSTCGHCVQRCRQCDENFCSACFVPHRADCAAAVQPA